MVLEDWVMLYEPLVRISCFVLGLVCLGALECYLPYRKYHELKKTRWLNTVFLITLSTGIARAIIHMIPVIFALQVAQNEVGIFHSVSVPYWVAVVASIIILDAFMYLQHRIMHRFPLLTRIHRVHHTDKAVDVTTGLRFHPAEIIIFMLFKFIGIMFLGAPILAVFIYEIMFSFFTQFTHANIRLPYRLEKMMLTLCVTPRMHRIHHSDVPYELNANYGFCFSLWDKFLGTYRYRSLNSEATLLFGLEGYFSDKFQTLSAMLLLPLNLKSLKPKRVKALVKRRAGDIPSERRGEAQ